MPESNDHPVHGNLSSAEFFIGQHSLFLGAAGQSFFYVHLFKPYFPVWIAMPFFLIPWITVFLIFYHHQPLFPPRQARHYWLYATYWYAALTVIAEIIWLLGYLPAPTPIPPVTPFASVMTFQVLMNIGWLSLVPLVHDYLRNPRLWS